MPRRKRKPKTTKSKTLTPPEGQDPVEFEKQQQQNAEALGQSAQQVIGKLPSLSRVTSVLMLFAGILIVGVLFYKVMVGFFIPLFMAAALAVIFRPIDQWLLERLGKRRRLAALGTTLIVLSIVLIPIVMLLSIAVGQLTSVVSRADLKEAKATLESARTKLGVELDYPDRFRRLDKLAGLLNDVEHPETVVDEVAEAKELIAFLDTNVVASYPSHDERENADQQLDDFQKIATAIAEFSTENADAERIELEEQFHRSSFVASASIHNWMNTKLGGSFRTQLKFLVNPSERDLSEKVRSVREFIQPRLAKFTSDTGLALLKFVFGMFIMILSVYFFLVDGPAMVRTLMRLSPLDDAYELRLLTEFEKTSRAVVLATVLAALAQGFLASVGFYFAGLSSVVLLFFITTVMSMVPFLGAGSVWVSCAIYIAAVEQRYTVAIIFTIYCMAIVATIDNVIKAAVLHGHSELHPLVALLSVLGGLSVFGPIGLLIGPMVVVFLQTLLEILNSELTPKEEQDEAAGDMDAEAAVQPS
ncbi:MAG: AI-2E family transporter [Planctomycetota bacterium]